MGEGLKSVDVTDVPEVLRLVEEVGTTNEPRLLQREGEDIALLIPVRTHPAGRARRAKSQSDRDAFLSSAGGWKGLVDAEELKADISESRRISTSPPVDL